MSQTKSVENAVDRVAGHAASLGYDDLPDLATTRARQVVLDTLGTTFGGYQSDLGELTVDYVAADQPGDAATLVGDGRRSTAEGAAWANGVMSKHVGMDDSHRTAGHVASEIVPIVLAVGENRNLSGEDVIVAMAAGYDVFDALQRPVEDWQRERGMDHKSQVGTLASAVTAAVAMDLSREEIGNALALAMDMASGTEQYVYDAGECDTKDLLSGYAARNGIQAAKMAAFGFRGPPGALDGEYGYFHAFGPGYDPSYLDRLGAECALANTGFKPHAGCRRVHACVDATQQIIENDSPDLDAITRIEVDTYEDAITPSFRVNMDPETVGQAGFSLPVTASVVLTRGSWYPEDIAAYDDPEIEELRRLVEVGLDEKIEDAHPEKNGCEVRVTTEDGKVHTGRVEYAKGEPENMLTDEEFSEKFRHLSDDVLHSEQLDRIEELTGRLEDLDDVSELVEATVPS
jgi:2-methylcitrate dehydratase PrpD